jgi:transcriptional regulator with XRE-family HTH domain
MKKLYCGVMKSTSGLSELPGDDWETRLTKQVFRNIAYYKEASGYTTAELARRYSKAVGNPDAMKPTTLNNLLAGKRKSVTMSETIAFAFALGIPPIALMVPFFSKGEVAALPGRDMSPVDFYRAIIGDIFHSIDGDDAGDEPSIIRHAFALLSRALDAETRLRNEFMSLGHLLNVPENYDLPASVIEKRRQEIVGLVAETKLARSELVGFGVGVSEFDYPLRWIEHIEPSEITLDLIREVFWKTLTGDGRTELPGVELARPESELDDGPSTYSD